MTKEAAAAVGLSSVPAPTGGAGGGGYREEGPPPRFEGLRFQLIPPHPHGHMSEAWTGSELGVSRPNLLSSFQELCLSPIPQAEMDPDLSGATPSRVPTLPLQVSLSLCQPDYKMQGGQAGAQRLFLGQMDCSLAFPIWGL